MSPVSPKDYEVSPANTLTFGNDLTAMFTVTNSEGTEWNEIQLEAPAGISKVQIQAGSDTVSTE